MTRDQQGEATRFLALLWGADGPPEGSYVQLWQKHASSAARAGGRTHNLTHWKGVPGVVAEGKTRDVYVCVSLAAREHPATSRLAARDAAGVAGLWCDLDVNGGPEQKEGAAPDRDAALGLAHRLLEPSIIVDSGYGIQPWWLIDGGPWIFAGTEDRDRAAGLAYGCVEAHRQAAAWKVDATQDLARLMRLPGTVNGKGDQAAPVRVLSDGGPRYTIEQLAGIFGSHRAPRASGGGADPEQLSFDPSRARFPHAAFDALCEWDRDFRLAWNHKRREQQGAGGWSPSQCEQSLANSAAAAGWPDEHIAGLIAAHRERHPGGDPSKGQRGDYLARTIATARNRRASSEAEREREAEREYALGELERLSDVTPNGQATDAARRVSLFNVVVASGRDGAPVFRELRQQGRDRHSARYVLVTASGEEVHVGGPRDLLRQDAVAAAIMAHTMHVMVPVKAPRWNAAIAALMSVCTVDEAPEDTPAGRMREWLGLYLDSSLAADCDESIQARLPFEREGMLHVARSHLMGWLRARRLAEHAPTDEISVWLKAAGLERVTINYSRRDGKRSTASYFRGERRHLE